jgi:putative SOS response-associated peptidase YedK
MVQCRWGFIPPSAKDEKVGYKMINARAETVATVPAFRSAFQNQRCLVVADGFYEWKKEEGRKIPFYIRRKSGKPFGFAGLFNIWTSPEGEDICTSTIITTDANELLFPIHDRMPAIIPEDRQDRWLDPTIHDRKVLIGLLEPYPPEELDMYEVSPRVNSPAYDSSDSIKPLKE